ncbi:MAG: glycine cleavage system protein GcvH [Gammaproteobacteria bacterium]|nr:glycine cleavage system protein GcvH [Gammaproteobacteria bacterium]
MADLRFTQDHEWVRKVAEQTVEIGISNYAQEQLGEIVFVELPEVDTTIMAGDDVSVIESVKAAGDLKAPVGGRITEVNERLTDEPELVNEDPTGEGWIMRVEIEDPEELDTLMDEAAYKAYTDALE